jgi:hypothetical protein
MLKARQKKIGDDMSVNYVREKITIETAIPEVGLRGKKNRKFSTTLSSILV